MSIRGATGVVVASVFVWLVMPAVARATPKRALVVRGAISFVGADGRAEQFSVATCESIARDHALTVRALGRPGPLVATALRRPKPELAAYDDGLCRLSFRVRVETVSPSYALAMGPRRISTWSRQSLVQTGGWVFVHVRGGAAPSSWRFDEVQQVHAPDVPRPPAEASNGVPFDPTAWQEEWTTTPGEGTDVVCALVGDGTSVRSGSFIVGNFASYRADWTGAPDRSKLWYQPLHPGGEPPLQVVAQRVDPSGTPVGEPVSVLRDAGAAWGGAGTYFYATSTLFPARGRWRLTATAGVNRGCFDFDL